MILVVDNTLSQEKAMYFPLLVATLKKLGAQYRVVSSLSELFDIQPRQVDGVILSGSPLMVTEKDINSHLKLIVLNTLCISLFDVPIMGICFGCQLITSIYGGTLTRMRTSFCKDAMVRYGMTALNGRFCLQYIVRKPPKEFEILATSNIGSHKNVPCLMKHKTKQLYACLFHPEYHEETHYIIRDFLHITRNK